MTSNMLAGSAWILLLRGRAWARWRARLVARRDHCPPVFVGATGHGQPAPCFSLSRHGPTPETSKTVKERKGSMKARNDSIQNGQTATGDDHEPCAFVDQLGDCGPAAHSATQHTHYPGVPCDPDAPCDQVRVCELCADALVRVGLYKGIVVTDRRESRIANQPGGDP